MYDICFKMAEKFTQRIYVNVILAIVIMLTKVLFVKSAAIKVDCGPIYDPYKELERPYQAHINWLPILGSVIYPNHSTEVGSIAKFRCEKGYYVRGAKYAVCGANGKWKIHEEELFCDRINCERPDFDIKHGKINTSVERPLVYMLNSVYWVTCDNGYKPNGSALRVCSVNGTDNNKGVWSQRNEHGEILQEGNTIPECIKDIHFIDCESDTNIYLCNRTNTITPNAVTTSSAEKHILVSIFGCAMLVEFIVIIILIIKLTTRNRATPSTKPSARSSNDDTEENIRLLENVERAEAGSDEMAIESENAEYRPQEVEKLNSKNHEAKNEHEDAKRECDELRLEKEKAESEHDEGITVAEEANKQLKQLQKYETMINQVKLYSNKQCSKCADHYNRFLELDHEWKRHVDTIKSIEEHIEKIESKAIETYILQNNESGIGTKLLKLLGKFSGIITGCDTEKYGSIQAVRAITEVHFKVSTLKEELGIPCKYCITMENNCTQKKYQVKQLKVVIIEHIKEELMSKIETFIDSISKSQASEEGNTLNKVLGRIQGLVYNSEINYHGTCTNEVYQGYSSSRLQNRSENGGQSATSNKRISAVARQSNIESDQQICLKLDNQPSGYTDAQNVLTINEETTTDKGKQIITAVGSENYRGNDTSLIAMKMCYNGNVNIHQSAVPCTPYEEEVEQDSLTGDEQNHKSLLDRQDDSSSSGKISTVEIGDHKSSAAEKEEQESSANKTVEMELLSAVEGTNTNIEDHRPLITEGDNQGFPATNDISNIESNKQNSPVTNTKENGCSVTDKESYYKIPSATEIGEQGSLVASSGHQDPLAIENQANIVKADQESSTNIDEKNGSLAHDNASSTENTDMENDQVMTTKIEKQKTSVNTESLTAANQSDAVQQSQEHSSKYNESDTEKVDHQCSGAVAEQKRSSADDIESMTADDLPKPENGSHEFSYTVKEHKEECARAKTNTTERKKGKEISEGSISENNNTALLVPSVSDGGLSKDSYSLQTKPNEETDNNKESNLQIINDNSDSQTT